VTSTTGVGEGERGRRGRSREGGSNLIFSLSLISRRVSDRKSCFFEPKGALGTPRRGEGASGTARKSSSVGASSVISKRGGGTISQDHAFDVRAGEGIWRRTRGNLMRAETVEMRSILRERGWELWPKNYMFLYIGGACP